MNLTLDSGTGKQFGPGTLLFYVAISHVTYDCPATYLAPRSVSAAALGDRRRACWHLLPDTI